MVSSMSKLILDTTGARLASAGGTWGEIQIAWMAQNLVLDVQAHNYDTADYLRRDHPVANIHVQTAVRLHRILGEAIKASLYASAGRGQPRLWPDATTGANASRWGRRAAG